MNNIGIFCSASNNIDAIFVDNVSTLGKWLGENQKTIIYGGVNHGLMEVVAKATHDSGGRVIGVIPEHMKEHASKYASEVIFTKDLSERKDQLLELANVFIALPGGIGTLDEVFHTLACNAINRSEKKIIFYNINGFFSNLLTCLAELKKGGFINKPLSELYIIANTESELKALLK